MFDMHNHILPGIDDGSQDLDTSLAMLRMAAEDGTTSIVATPHIIEGNWLPDWDEILEKYRIINQEAKKAGLTTPVYPGGEVAVNIDLLDIIKGPGPYCINSGGYILVELPAMEIPSFTEDFFFTLQARGITPILAHPERHPQIYKKPEILVDWINKGILMQVNAPSINGRMGEHAQQTAELLLENNMVHLIGTDAHGIKSRRPLLSKAAQKITAMAGAKKTQELLYINPEKIINSLEVEIVEVDYITKPHKNTGIFSFITKLWA